MTANSAAPLRRAAHRLLGPRPVWNGWTGACSCNRWACPGWRATSSDVVQAWRRHVDNAQPVDWDSTAEYHDQGMP